MTRRCSNCNSNGHNCRKCPTRLTSVDSGGSGGGGGSAGVKLFGVRLTDGSIMKKSASVGNLSHYRLLSSAASPNPASPSIDPGRDTLRSTEGYASDGPIHASSSSSNHRTERKKGIPWTVEEHRLFLLGLKKLGKGDWRGISKNFVTSRTPTQVASHAQKYFVRQTNSTRRRRRSSLFDMYPESGDSAAMLDERPGLPPRRTNSSTEELAILHPQEQNSNERSLLTFVDLSIKQEEFEPMEVSPFVSGEETTTREFLKPPVNPCAFRSFFQPFVPLQFQVWPETDGSQHQILKPIPVFPKEPVNIDKLLGISEMNIGDSGSCLTDSSQLSVKFTGEPSRKSAFHVNTPHMENNQGKGLN